MDAQERAHSFLKNFCLHGTGTFNHSKRCCELTEQIRQAEQAAREKALEEVAKDLEERALGLEASKAGQSSERTDAFIDHLNFAARVVRALKAKP